ncbi:radical SAM protein [Cellulosilyticum sp. ST5]|uniref:radical SAM protein n=1 Tax=Cellulosilyticum sp. ST5 TaxID=3055805 RepID=UPI003977947C
MYKPITAVWEITMGCNMQCKHCGSSCSSALIGELTTEEALGLCKEIGELGLKWITLSGGEPTIRKDWHQIAKALNENGVIPNMITNGWLFSEKEAQKAEAAGINTLAISIDGLQETHDYMRREGSFECSMNAFECLRNTSVHTAAITTIHNKNINELKQIKNILIDKGVERWQLQIGLPMGNMAHHQDLVTPPEIINDIINFAYEETQKGGIIIDLADCIGYFNAKEIEVREKNSGQEGYGWDGCGAGKHNFGILHNGDIIGCVSIRDNELVEGNIREEPLKSIWEKADAFSWNRQLVKEQLKGNCQKCKYGSICKGGCTNSRLVHKGSIYEENKYCSYSLVMDQAQETFSRVIDTGELLLKSMKFLQYKQYQLAEMTLSLYLEHEPFDLEAYKNYGFVAFMLENYEEAKKCNESILKNNPLDVYALKGLGLTLAKMGQVEEGIAYLKRAIEHTDHTFLDPYYDLAITLVEDNQLEEAQALIYEATLKYKEFKPYEELFNKRLGIS